ncbi:MAG: GNAT family protein [Lysinibacillus sp.]
MEIERIYSDLPILETERLILRKVSLEDVEDMYLYCSDEDVARDITWNAHKTITDTKSFIESILKQYENKQVAPWGIEYKENGRLIGNIDFVWWQPNHQTAEIAYVLSKEYWGKGLITEAVKEIIRFGFNEMDLVRIQARCFVENIGSYRVLEKSGMQFEGIIRKGLFVKGEHQDLKVYSIIREDLKKPDSINTKTNTEDKLRTKE